MVFNVDVYALLRCDVFTTIANNGLESHCLNLVAVV